MLLYRYIIIVKTFSIETEISEFTCHHVCFGGVNKQFLQINFKSDNHI